MQIEKVYEPQRFEPHWAQWWIDSGIFRASPHAPGRVFSLVIPPPNVTGVFHIGHMLEHTEIDVTIRWHRMLGDNTLWLPGTDHAGIATQMVVERQLAEEFDRCATWAAKNSKSASGSGRNNPATPSRSRWCGWAQAAIGRASASPSTPAFRARCAKSSSASTKRVSSTAASTWSTGARAATPRSPISKWRTRKRPATSGIMRYPVIGMNGRFLTVATTRPETMLGDTAVAINPKDARYFDLHGKTVMLPLMNREIPIILDDMADPQFGTGAVKVTPAHDPNDFEAGRRHNLPNIKVIDEAATHDRGRRTLRRARPLRSAQARRGRSRTSPARSKRSRLQAQPRPLPSLQDARRAADFDAVVREDRSRSPRKPSRRSRPGASSSFRENWTQDLFRVDVQHPRLVHFAPALVGPSHSRVALRRVQGDHGGARGAVELLRAAVRAS